MATTSLVKNYKSVATLVHFNAGTAGELKICDLSTSLTVTQGTFLPDPRIEFVFPERSGGFEEKEITIKMQNSKHSLIQRMLNGYPFAPVTIDVYEYLFDEIGSATTNTLHIWSGKVSQAIDNDKGRDGIVTIKGKNLKDRMNFSLGISCNVQCSWTFGDSNCQKTVSTESATIASINGTTITLSASPAGVAKLYSKGYISRQGINILIREWVSGTTMYLSRMCPPDWLNQSVTLNAGCDRFLDTCVGVHNNQPKFGGLGFLMTAYNPTAEEP